MPAYMLFIREEPIRDEAAYAEYQAVNRAKPEGGPRPTPVVLCGDLEAVEGKAPDGIIMLKFDSVEEAKEWYNSPGYQAAVPHRQRAADYRAIIVEGVA